MSELRDQHKAFAEWFLQQNPIAPNAEDLAWAAWKAALAQPETEPVAWRVRWIDPEEGPGVWVPTRDPDVYRSRPTYEVRPLYAHPPRDEWCEAVHAELVTTWTFSAENKDDPRKALQDIINWHVSVSLDPAISSDAQALIERGKAMRSGWRPASEPPEDGRRVLIWVATESGGETFRPAYCPAGGWTSVFDGETLVAWRDVTPPTEGAR